MTRTVLAALFLLASAAPYARAGTLDELFRSKLGAAEQEQAKALPLDKVAQRLNPAQRASIKAELDRHKSSQDVVALNEVAKGYLLLGDPASAASVAERIKSLDPEDPSGYRIAADAAFRLGSYQAAAEQAAGALGLNPKDAAAMAVYKLALGQGARVSAAPHAPSGFPERLQGPARGGRTAQAVSYEAGAGSPAPADLGPGERVLTQRDIQRLESLLAVIAKTETGRRILQEVMDKTGGRPPSTVAELAANDVEVRATKRSRDFFADVRKEGRKAVIAMPGEALDHRRTEQAAAAASAAEALGQVAVLRKEGNGFSFVVMKEKTVLYAIHVYEELKNAGQGCSGGSALCEGWRLLSRIWEDDLENNPAQEGEFSDGKNIAMLKKARRDESEDGLKGTAEINQIIMSANIAQDVKRGVMVPKAVEFRQELADKDQKFRAATGYTLK